MPAGAEEEENGVCTFGDGAGYLGEVGVDGGRVGRGHDQRGRDAAPEADGGEE